MKKGLVVRPLSRRSAVHSCQAELFVLLARELVEAYTRSQSMGLEDWFELPEYRRFVLGAYGTGFVCTDLAPMAGFDGMSNRPREHLSRANFNEIRHWTHTLLRAERWAHPFASPIRAAIDSGALEIVADRLEIDDSLRQQEELLDEIVTTDAQDIRQR